MIAEPPNEHLASSRTAIAKEILLVALVAFLLVRAFWLVPERESLGPFGMAFDKVLRQAIAILFAVALAVKWLRWWIARERGAETR